jgi:hypothetical protein
LVSMTVIWRASSTASMSCTWTRWIIFWWSALRRLLRSDLVMMEAGGFSRSLLQFENKELPEPSERWLLLWREGKGRFLTVGDVFKRVSRTVCLRPLQANPFDEN